MKHWVLWTTLWLAVLQMANATVLQYRFSAVVETDAGSPLVQPGDVINGAFSYDIDPTTAFHFPTNPMPFTWDRPMWPIGIMLDVNGTILAQNPQNFARMFILNNETLLGDQLVFGSFIVERTAEDPFEYSGAAMFLVLSDTNATAFDSSGLPSTLSRDDFSSANLIVYDGVNPYFAASVTSFALVPEPKSIVLATMALLLIWNLRSGHSHFATEKNSIV